MNSNTLENQVLRYSALAILLAGIGLRINQYASNRSLWIDEAMLALNIVNRSFGNLMGPLDYSQGAPLGFLIIQKMMVTAFGGNDYVLRIFPFAASLAALYLMYRVSVRYVGGIGALVALGFFSLSDRMIYYASENKQYSTDVLFSLVLLLFAGKCLEQDAKRSYYVFLCAFGVLSIFFSHPALFILSGVAMGLVMNGFVARDKKMDMGGVDVPGMARLLYHSLFCIFKSAGLKFKPFELPADSLYARAALDVPLLVRKKTFFGGIRIEGK